MKKVLVTGGSGFVGRAVLKALSASEVEIHVISRGDVIKDLTNETKISIHQLSLLEFSRVSQIIREIQPEYLIHLAWDVKQLDYLHSSENLDWVGASLNVLKVFVQSGGKRAFFCGTCFEYEFTENPASEQKTKIKPLTLYAQCKASLHDIVKKYCQDNQLSFVWGRLFYLFGENEAIHRVVPYVITELLNKKEVTCKNASAIRDYLYIADAGKAIVKTLFSDVVGAVNIASGQPVTMRQIFQLIGEKCHSADRIYYLDEPVVPKQVVAEVAILQKTVGFTEYTDWQQALERTIDWWRGKIE